MILVFKKVTSARTWLSKRLPAPGPGVQERRLCLPGHGAQGYDKFYLLTIFFNLFIENKF